MKNYLKSPIVFLPIIALILLCLAATDPIRHVILLGGGNITIGTGTTNANTYYTVTGIATVTNLNDLADVDGTPNDGDVLTYNFGTGLWGPVAPTGGASGIATNGGYGNTNVFAGPTILGGLSQSNALVDAITTNRVTLKTNSIASIGWVEAISNALNLAKQDTNAALGELADLGNGTGFLYNNGSGTYSWAPTNPAAGGGSLLSTNVVKSGTNIVVVETYDANMGTNYTVSIVPNPQFTNLTTADLTVGSNANARFLLLSNVTASTVIIADANKRITNVPNAAGYLKNDGAGTFTFDTPSGTSLGIVTNGGVGNTNYFGSPVISNATFLGTSTISDLSVTGTLTVANPISHVALTNVKSLAFTNFSNAGILYSTNGGNVYPLVIGSGLALSGSNTLTATATGGGGTNSPVLVLAYADDTNVLVDASTPTGCIPGSLLQYRLTMTTNCFLINPTNTPWDGQKIEIEFIQDAVGGRVLYLDSAYKFGTDITGLILTTNASKRDFVTFYNNGTNWYCRGFTRGY